MSKLEANNKSLKREINEAHINIQEREHTIKIKSLELEELLQKLEIISEEHKAMSGQRKELEKKVHTLNSDNQLLVKKILELKEEQVKRFNEANEIYEEAAKLRKDSLLTKYDENSASQGFLEFDMSDINPQYILASPVGLTVRRTPHCCSCRADPSRRRWRTRTSASAWTSTASARCSPRAAATAR